MVIHMLREYFYGQQIGDLIINTNGAKYTFLLLKSVAFLIRATQDFFSPYRMGRKCFEFASPKIDPRRRQSLHFSQDFPTQEFLS